MGYVWKGDSAISGEDAELNLKKGIAFGDLKDSLKGADSC